MEGELKPKFKVQSLFKLKTFDLKGWRQKKNSIFKDIAQIGGGEVNPISKN